MRAGESFFDTNVILYLFSEEAAKADRAEELLAQGGRISVQVLNELASVGRRKLGLSWREVAEITAQIQALCVVTPLTLETHVKGLQIAERFGFSVYDGMIVASASLAGCAVLYTEDMQDGLHIEEALTLRNPFARR